jgi:CMP-N-acetylneuraminic acid synthetase
MIEEPLITVYITNRNYGKYLENAFKSVLIQSFKSFEIIVIDDASNDNSKYLIKKFEAKNLCRAIYNKKRKGLIKSSNIAIKAAKGKFIIRLDADDYLEKNALAILYDGIKRDKNIALIYSDYFLVDEKKNILSLEKQMNRSKSRLDDKPVLAACCLIRKSSMFSVNLYDERFNRQDGYDLWYKLIQNYKLKHIALPLFFYRRHGNNLTKNQSRLYKTRTKILRKFSEKKSKIKNLHINCVIPVRGPNINKNCYSLEKVNNKPLIFYSIDEALKINEFNKVILSTADLKLINLVKKKYKNKIFYHKRPKHLSEQNIDFKEAVINAINKYEKKIIDLLVIMTYENPLRKSFYINQAISNLIIHDSDSVIGTVPDIDNNYYKYSEKGLKLISNEKDNKLRLEKNLILKDVGAFTVYKYKSYLKSNNFKTTSIVLDENDSFIINNKKDLKVLKEII